MEVMDQIITMCVHGPCHVTLPGTRLPRWQVTTKLLTKFGWPRTCFEDITYNLHNVNASWINMQTITFAPPAWDNRSTHGTTTPAWQAPLRCKNNPPVLIHTAAACLTGRWPPWPLVTSLTCSVQRLPPLPQTLWDYLAGDMASHNTTNTSVPHLPAASAQ